MHDNDVQKEGAGEIVRIKFLSRKQAKEIAELCGNTENGMKPIQDGVELVGFLRGTFPIEEKEAKVLLEYLDGHGYMLAGGRRRTVPWRFVQRARLHMLGEIFNRGCHRSCL